MWKSTFFVTALFFSLSLTGLTACKSDGQKKVERAQDLVAAQNAIVRDLQGMGTPTARWSDADLNAYEAKINELADTEAQLRAMNGCSNGACVSSYGFNDGFISQERSRVASIRSAKRTASGSGVFSERKLSDLTLQWQQQAVEIDQLGEPNSQWSVEQLRELLQKIQAHQKTQSELSEQINSIPSGTASQAVSNMKTILQTTGQKIDQLRSQVNTLIGKNVEKNSIPPAPTNTQSSVSNSLDSKINALATPDVGWTMEQLNEYAQKCDELTAQLQRQGATQDQLKAVEDKKSAAAAIRVKKLMGLMNKQTVN